MIMPGAFGADVGQRMTTLTRAIFSVMNHVYAFMDVNRFL